MRDSWMERFWRKVKKSDKCWEWAGATGLRLHDQYGRLKIKGVNYKAHRISYAIHNKLPLAFEGFVLHRCDNPKCVRPDHLELGDHKKNMQDMVERGRHRPPPATGAANGNAKLTSAQVKKIRSLLRKGLNNKEIAALFSVRHQTISCIKLKKSWAH